MNKKETKSSKVLKLLIYLLIFAGLGCGGYFIYKKQLTTTESFSFTPTPTIKNTLQGGISDSQYYTSKIYFDTSKDNLTWDNKNRLLFDHAGAPEAVLKNNKIYLYFVNAETKNNQISVAISNNSGETFEKPQKVNLENISSNDITDFYPEIINNNINLNYKKNNQSYFAISKDGINFDNPQEKKISPEAKIDSAIIQLTDGTYLMFYEAK